MNATVLSLVLATVFAPPAKTSAERSTRIYVRTTPPGASIVLDGKELGTSDGLFLVPPGVRKITLEMDGYHPEGRPIDVKEGWITRVEVRMVKKGVASEAAMLSQAKLQLLKYKDALSEKLNHYGEQHPEIVSLRSRIQTTENRIELLGVQTSTPPHLDPPAAVVETFLEAVRVGDDEKAASLFTPAARAQVARLGYQVAPKASDTATFDVVKVTSIDDHATVVATWTDHDRTDRTVWIVRSGDEGWRIFGMEATVFPGEPPLVLDFEKLEESMEKIRMLRETVQGQVTSQVPGMPADAEASTDRDDLSSVKEQPAEDAAGFVELKKRRVESIVKLEELLKTYGEQHPKVRELRSSIQAVDGSLEEHRTTRLDDLIDGLTRNIHLPDADTKDTPVVLDLASGEMLMPPPSHGAAAMEHFTKLGKGDIGVDHGLFCLRGGKIQEMKDGAIRPREDDGRSGDATLYRLPALPCELLVTTAEKRQFLVKVLEETDKGGLRIEYQEQSKAQVEPDVAESVPSHATAPVRKSVDADVRMKLSEAEVQMARIEAAMEHYRLDTGKLLSMKHGFHALLRCPDDIADPESWNGPYVKTPDGSIPLDPWGNPYLCSKQGTGDNEIRGILSFGPDGKGGTADDLRNWAPDDYSRLMPEPDVPAGILEFRIAANEEEAKSFSEDGTDLGWYDSLMDSTANLVTREQGRRTQVLLWQTPDKSMTASDDNEKKWRVIEVSVIAEPDKPGRIGIVFDKEGGRHLQKLTAGHVNRHMAMLVDGRVVSCPMIRSAIGPRVEITGDFSKAELNRLATALQAGMEPSRP
jgi:type II secretion system protein G